MSWKQQAYVQIDWVGNFTAAAGCCIYDGGAWPAKYNYTHYVAEPTLNIVHQDVLTPKGVTYVASKAPETAGKEFVASTDCGFVPSTCGLAPMARFTCSISITRLSCITIRAAPSTIPRAMPPSVPTAIIISAASGACSTRMPKPAKVPNLAKASTADFVKALDHPNEWVRMTAQRLLRETADPSQLKTIANFASDSTKSPEGRILALWLMGNLNGLNESMISASLADKSPVVRKNTLQISGCDRRGCLFAVAEFCPC